MSEVNSNSESQYPVVPDTVKQMLDEALYDRSLSVAHADDLCSDLLRAGQELGVQEELGYLLTGLLANGADHLVQALKSAKKVSWLQQEKLGKNHPALALTELVMAICYLEQREFRRAVETLRSVITRFEQMETPDGGLFVRSVCLLAGAYNSVSNFSAARTALKQAHRIATSYAAPVAIQSLVLEELGSCLLQQRHFKGARDTFLRLVECRGYPSNSREATATVKILIKLALCHTAVFQSPEAEPCLLQAAAIFQRFALTDRGLIVRLLDTLAGVLRQLGEFTQADLVDQHASELLGRLDQAGGHALYGTLLKEAADAETIGDQDTAVANYRRALCALEAHYEKRPADRIQILAKLYLCTKPEQNIQRASLLTAIEDAVLSMFSSDRVDFRQALARIAVLFHACGNHAAGDNLDHLAESLMEVSLTSSKSLRLLTSDLRIDEERAV